MIFLGNSLRFVRPRQGVTRFKGHDKVIRMSPINLVDKARRIEATKTSASKSSFKMRLRRSVSIDESSLADLNVFGFFRESCNV